MTQDLKAVVERALFEGANPRGFSAELKAVYDEMTAPPAPEPEPAPVAVVEVPKVEAKPKPTKKPKKVSKFR